MICFYTTTDINQILLTNKKKVMDQWQYVLDRLDSIEKKFDEKLGLIEENSVATLVQTTKTNGRVTAIEDWKRFVGKVLWAVAGVILTVLGFYLQNYISKH